MSEGTRTFVDAPIDGVIVRKLKKFSDERGWLSEIWRKDQLDTPIQPAMTYISETLPGIARGPHEHVDQTDNFCFMGPGTFQVVVWDNRPSSATYDHKQVFEVGADDPSVIIVPEGVVHAYRNISDVRGIVINSPNRLYRGVDYTEEVDEIRHEADPDSPFVMA